ncbi:MAG TPA: hypothetical protein VLW45_02190 [Pelomicrobium sp.]|nr:hypothetical protein [Pelomicrobium sp.]
MPDRLLSASFALLLAAFPLAAAAEDDRWTRFGREVHELLQRELAGREIRTEESRGDYYGVAAAGYGWRAVRYVDAVSGRLLGIIHYDRDRPEVVHFVEAYVYDERGRVVRDYAAVYLPWRTHRPARTFVNLHAYNGGLHAFRQFDALGNHLRDQCEGTFRGRAVSLSLDENDIYDGPPPDELRRACFAGLPEQAGAYLKPH